MSDENTPLEEGKPPAENAALRARMEKARAGKTAKRKQRDEVGDLIQSMRSEIADLRRQVEAAKETVEVSAILPSGERAEPGTIVNISTNPAQPDFRKVRWSDDDIERKYQMIEFTPEEGMTVGAHGRKWDLRRRETVRVPSIVKDLHDAEIYRLEHLNDRYRPITIAEHYAAAERAMLNPGTPIWSRLYIIPGGGLDMGTAPEESEPAKSA